MIRRTDPADLGLAGRNSAVDSLLAGEPNEVMTMRILEDGDIFFGYRPKVDASQVRGPADVQRFFVILKPRENQRSGG